MNAKPSHQIPAEARLMRTASELGSLGAQAARYSRMGTGKICTLVAPTDCHWDPAVAPPKCEEPIATPRTRAQAPMKTAESPSG